MNEAKHTKGPWPAKLTSDGCLNVTIGEQQISFVNHADGCLVSAAPDLLHELCNAVNALKCSSDQSVQNTATVASAERIIAKAEGK